MSINIRRFDPKQAVSGHEGTILGADILPEGMKAPFYHQYGYLQDKGTAMAGHAHPTDEIYIVFSGTGYVIVGGQNRAVCPGDTIVIPAGQWHTMLCTDKDKAPLLWAALWWERSEKDEARRTLDPNNIYSQRFDKDKAHLAHLDTILADAVVPACLPTPFDHAYGYLENGNAMELHKHPTEEVYIVYSGKGFVTVNDEQCAVSPGDVIEIPPNCLHTMTAQENGPFLWAALWWMPA